MQGAACRAFWVSGKFAGLYAKKLGLAFPVCAMFIREPLKYIRSETCIVLHLSGLINCDWIFYSKTHHRGDLFRKEDGFGRFLIIGF